MMDQWMMGMRGDNVFFPITIALVDTVPM